VTRAWKHALASGIAVAALLVASAPTEAKPKKVKLDPRYLDLLQRYARGDRPRAIAALGAWSDGALQKQVGLVEDARVEAERCVDCSDPLAGLPLRAAVMLHADRDKVERPDPAGREQTPRCPGPHARIATRYAAVLARVPTSQDFAHRFFLTMALLWQHRACFEDALLQAREGLELFPRSAELLLTAGCVLEERAILTLASGGSNQPSHLPREWLKEARRDLEDSVANDPDLVLAKVRLGRVLWRLGLPEPAREVLEAARGPARDPDHRYLAHLFLGRIHEDAERLDEALVEYRRAVLVHPEAQSAAVALAHALQLTGDMEGSRQAMARGLPPGPRKRDPFSDYLAGNTEGVDGMEAALHREALE
jgi:tetratricopeptide (TPR) repeat protein